MPIFCTTMQVLDNSLGELITIDGMRIDAPSWDLAEQFIYTEGYTWLTITGQLVAEIPCSDDDFTPDWEHGIDYDKIQQN